VTAHRTARLHVHSPVSVLLFMTSRCLIFIATLSVTLAQSPTARKEFDIVSVKASAPDDHNSFMFQNLPGGSIRLVGVPLRMIIMQAYGVKSFQISGGPDWTRTDRWDILAKAEGVEGRLSGAQENPMLRSLMAERFQLRVHSEIKEMPVYALVVEKNGSKLVLHSDAEQQFRNVYGSLVVKKGGMAALAAWLSRGLGRMVIDKTDLKGEYDYALEWTPDPGEGGPESIGLPPEPPTVHAETNGPSIFTALQEQLGLRLVSQRGPVEVIVIDSVDKPSAN
jgi:bla regulator protein blaR1